MAEYTCKVCGLNYPEKQKSCPRCGCLKGDTVPAYLRCNRCGTILSSKHETCPDCGLDISPRTATVALLPPDEPEKCRKQKTKKIIAAILLFILLLGEFFLVKIIYTKTSYNNAIELWGTEVSIEKNRRAPDKIIPLTVEERPDTIEEKDNTYRGPVDDEEEYIEDIPEEILEEVIEDIPVSTEAPVLTNDSL